MIYLYVKTHNNTGLKYFGKTENKNPYSYTGSGKYWLRHLATHGKDFDTKIIAEFENSDDCREFAVQFSKDNNIVKSEEWANLIEENGLDGAPIGNAVKQETKDKISKSLVGKPSPKSKYEIKEDVEVRVQRYKDISADTIWINNGVSSKRVKEMPEGWTLGRLKSQNIGDKTIGSRNLNGSNTRGRVIYNNGTRHAFYIEGTQPDGWIRGKMSGYQGGTGTMKKGKTYGK